ncbi:MAG: heme exporter protein CcmD [Alphaproteobacteria bacterium]|jgi:heme exporter protein CcmD|nr:heme exporter protein CcmD [Alphaproteobacteria bacterium]
MYDTYIYASYGATFLPLAWLIASSFAQWRKAKAELAASQ